MNDYPDLWERQPEETEEEWLAFRAYRDMSMPRKLKHLVDPSKNLLYPMSKTSKWYRDNAWEIRVREWESHLDQISLAERTEAHTQGAQQVADAHRALLVQARELASVEVAKLLARAKEDAGMGLLRPAEVIKLIEAAVKLERLVLGESTENVHEDFSNLSMDELKVMEELATKAQQTKSEETRH